MTGDPALDEGWVEADLAAELPGLRVLSTTVTAAGGPSPRPLKARLRTMADRWYGARALMMRREPVPHAYRVLFRHLGLDPDTQRPPQEEAIVDRLIGGGFRSAGLLSDALLIAVVETGVPVLAFDETRIDGPVGLRAARDGERLGEGELASDLPPGRVVLADAERPLAILFGAVAADVVAGRDSRSLRLVAVVAPGVPAMHAEEALWLAREALEDGAGAVG